MIRRKYIEKIMNHKIYNVIDLTYLCNNVNTVNINSLYRNFNENIKKMM